MNFFDSCFQSNEEMYSEDNYYHYSSPNYNDMHINYIAQEKSYSDISKDQEFGLVGLRNNKNVCYMNAFLQILKNIHPLVNYFIYEYINNNTLEISNVFKYILAKLLYKKTYTSAICLKTVMEKYDDYFKGIEFKDSLNFYISLLSMMHKELNVIKKEKKYENYLSDNNEDYFIKKKNEFFAKNNSIIIDTFYGFQKNIFFCENCKNKSEKFQAFNFLDFPIKKNELKIKNLENCFEIYQKQDKLQIECENCKKGKLNVKYEIFSLPKILVIAFKKGDHIKHKVYFNEKLFMNRLIENKEEKNKQYNLIGFINHIENSNNSHNYCITKNIFNNKWYLFSDTTIYRVDQIQPFLHEAILLIYQLSGIEMPKNSLNKLKSIIQIFNEKNK